MSSHDPRALNPVFFVSMARFVTIVCSVLVALSFQRDPVGLGFKFFDVVPRGENGESIRDPVLVCNQDLQCLVSYEVANRDAKVGVRRSDDGGETWGEVDFLSGREESFDPDIDCTGNFCVVVFRMKSNTVLGASISNDFGRSFGRVLEIHKDTDRVGQPGVGCFLETCVVGAYSRASGTFVIYDVFAPETVRFRQEIIPAAKIGNQIYIECNTFCVAGLGGGANMEILKRDLLDTRFQSGVVIPQSLDVLSTSRPEIEFISADEVVIVSSNARKSDSLGQIEISVSTDQGQTFGEFKPVAADAQRALEKPSISCQGSVCALVFDVRAIDAPPMFVLSPDAFNSFTKPEQFAGFIQKQDGEEDMYASPKVHWVSGNKFLAVCEGENFIQDLVIDKESIITSFLEVDPEQLALELQLGDQNQDVDNLLQIVVISTSSVFGAAILFVGLAKLTKRFHWTRREPSTRMMYIQPEVFI